MKIAYPALMLSLVASTAASAEKVTYNKHVRPLWEAKCATCHGSASPYLAEFLADKDKFIKLARGPRMDSYANLVMYVGWPDAGAIMRRLDDGKNTKNGKPGNMYMHLGADEGERQKNLAVFKNWVGEEGWVLKKFKDLTREELGRMKVAE